MLHPDKAVYLNQQSVLIPPLLLHAAACCLVFPPTSTQHPPGGRLKSKWANYPLKNSYSIFLSPCSDFKGILLLFCIEQFCRTAKYSIFNLCLQINFEFETRTSVFSSLTLLETFSPFCAQSLHPPPTLLSLFVLHGCGIFFAAGCVVPTFSFSSGCIIVFFLIKKKKSSIFLTDHTLERIS